MNCLIKFKEKKNRDRVFQMLVVAGFSTYGRLDSEKNNFDTSPHILLCNGTIYRCNWDGSDNTIYFEEEGLPFSLFELLDNPPVKINGRYVEFSDDGSITVGCTTVTAEEIDRIYKTSIKKRGSNA